ncbi:MAG: two pore domain potassium channel family protein [Thermoleophilia bacterium]|nr:two pore domain potassium channel family protein [Thermoleophilia bacterium]
MPAPLRSFERFAAQPASIRRATVAIASTTVFAVVAGAVLVRIFAPKEYPNIGRALWFTLQTVTTVGYGDVTPHSPVARVVAAVVMLTAIALITVLTAVITSTFIEAIRNARGNAVAPIDAEAVERIEAGLAALTERLDRIEHGLASEREAPDEPPPGRDHH